MKRDSNQDTQPWYRHFYVWLLITFPVLSVVAGITMLVFSIKTYDGLVVDDYYKRGLEINRVFERDRAAAEHDLAATLLIDNESPRFRVLLESDASFQQPAAVTVNFLHATRGGQDREADLQAVANGIYEGVLPSLAAGDWNVLIEAQDWRLLKRWRSIPVSDQ